MAEWFHRWESWTPGLYLQSDDWTHRGALPPQVGPIRFYSARAPMSLNVDKARSRFILNDGPERAIERNIAATSLCRNATIVLRDLCDHVKAKSSDQAYIDNALRTLAMVLFDPDQLEILEELVRSEIPTNSRLMVGNAIRFLRTRVCTPRDMPLNSMEQFAGATNWLLHTLQQEL